MFIAFAWVCFIITSLFLNFKNVFNLPGDIPASSLKHRGARKEHEKEIKHNLNVKYIRTDGQVRSTKSCNNYIWSHIKQRSTEHISIDFRLREIILHKCESLTLRSKLKSLNEHFIEWSHIDLTD